MQILIIMWHLFVYLCIMVKNFNQHNASLNLRNAGSDEIGVKCRCAGHGTGVLKVNKLWKSVSRRASMRNDEGTDITELVTEGVTF